MIIVRGKNKVDDNFCLPKILLWFLVGLLSACSTVYKNSPPADQASPPRTPSPSYEALLFPQNSPASKVHNTLANHEQNIWSKINRGASFAAQIEHPRIEKFIKRYQNNSGDFKPIFERASLYLPHVTNQLAQNKLPLELALLPFVESAYDPFAYSSSGAAGLWQFIPSTGDHMGLTRNWWYDGRRDVLRSTEAAINYLTYLNQRFQGDWLLTLAAYNGGEGTVSRAMQKNARQGKDTDFWSLNLSGETEAYVPHLVALAKICANPQRYGLTLPILENTETFTTVDVARRIHLEKAAELASIDYELLTLLNPAFRRGVTPPDGPHRLLIPPDKAEHFLAKIANTPEHLWQPARQYLVQPGDTLSEIALKNSVPLTVLKNENELKSDHIAVGRLLNIPGTGISFVAPTDNTSIVYYRVRKGDSLWKIARSFKVSSRELMRWNKLTGKHILRPGQKIKIQPAVSDNRHSSFGPVSAELKYRVKPGDSLYSIALRHRISIADITRRNRISSSDLLHPGQFLHLPVRS